ncbi:hypothetical protein [Paenibacillus gallinarum]|uniref:Uncharacterized protein n=1 Tax=Paenibacillus gallinarum TaxID=2762232 RepID=A0ABR8T4I1_9BACL|nr:hypothetical protein [Paenibacillus gallinarum]MBD7970438.1 hypothetical protein [Paenibacillus gallinarum]
MIRDNDSLLIHEREDRRMEPFFWILTFEAMAVLIVLAIAMIAGPIVLLWYYPAWWAYTLLAVGGVLGVLLARFTYRYLTKLVRKNRRLSTYRIYEDRIEAVVYDADGRNAAEIDIPLVQVESVYASVQVVNQAYHYQKTGWTERLSPFDVLPILYIAYNSGRNRRVLTIPFYKDDSVDRWLGALQKREIPIQVIDRMMQSVSEAFQLDAIDSGDYTYPFLYKGNFKIDIQHAVVEIERKKKMDIELAMATGEEEPLEDPTAEEERKTAASSYSSSSQTNATPPGKELVPGDSDARWLRFSSIGILVLLVASLYPIVLLEETRIFPDISVFLCFGLLFAGALAYFYRMRQLKGWAAFRFVLITSLGWIILGLSLETRGEIAYETTSIASAIALLQPVLVWLPYYAAVWIRRRWPASYHLVPKPPRLKRLDGRGKGGSA